jgi:hypothetical protein
MPNQMPKENQNPLFFDWALLFYWMMATTMGWLLGWLLLSAIALVAAGVGTGVLQSLVLYRRIPRAWCWILATAVGWLAGLAIAIVVVPPGFGLLSGAVIGATTGTAQWRLLRPQVHWAGWWIVVSALAWATGLSLAPASGLVVLPRIVLSGVMSTILTGITLELLLRNPKEGEGETASLRPQ